MNFRLRDEGDGWIRLTTETRVFALDASARRRFAAYWRLISPGSAFIRRMWRFISGLSRARCGNTRHSAPKRLRIRRNEHRE